MYDQGFNKSFVENVIFYYFMIVLSYKSELSHKVFLLYLSWIHHCLTKYFLITSNILFQISLKQFKKDYLSDLKNTFLSPKRITSFTAKTAGYN